MATTTTPEVKTKTAPIGLTANAVVKVKEIQSGTTEPCSRWPARERGRGRMFRLLVLHAVRERRGYDG